MSFKNHEVSACHREAVEVCVTLPATCEHIGEQLSTQFAEENKSNRKMLIKILSSLQLLARQGLPIRGDGALLKKIGQGVLYLRGVTTLRVLW